MEFEKIDFREFKIPDVELPTIQDDLYKKMYSDFVYKKNNIIREFLIKCDINPNDLEFIKQNIQRVVFEEDDKYEHYFYHFGRPDEKRIISIERNAKIDFHTETEGFSCRISATQNYY